MAKSKADPTADPLVISPFPAEAASVNADAPPPPHATPKVVDAGGPLPRVVPELARAVPGTERFKVRVLNMGELGDAHRYVLAAKGDEAGAKKCFLEATGLSGHLAKIKRDGGAPVEPVFAVKALAD